MTQEYKVITDPDNPLCGMTYGEVKEVVRKDGNALVYVKSQTEELCALAVQQNVDALQFVKNQTEELCKLAIQQDWSALYYVEKQTEEICNIALARNKKAKRYVNKDLFKIKLSVVLRS